MSIYTWCVCTCMQNTSRLCNCISNLLCFQSLSPIPLSPYCQCVPQVLWGADPHPPMPAAGVLQRAASAETREPETDSDGEDDEVDLWPSGAGGQQQNTRPLQREIFQLDFVPHGLSFIYHVPHYIQHYIILIYLVCSCTVCGTMLFIYACTMYIHMYIYASLQYVGLIVIVHVHVCAWSIFTTSCANFMPLFTFKITVFHNACNMLRKQRTVREDMNDEY